MPAVASPRDSWVKAAERWVTGQDWPAGWGKEDPEAWTL